MAEKDLSRAEYLLAKAEQLNVNYGSWYQGDTPEAVRRDLGRMQQGASNPAVASAPAKGQTLLERSDALLLKARRALSVKDVRTAEKLVQQADALGAPYRQVDDRPVYVRKLIDTHHRLQQKHDQEGNSLSYRKAYADFLMKQADGLLRRMDFEEAHRLAAEAARQGINYNAVDRQQGRTPQAMMQRIQDAKIASRDMGMTNDPSDYNRVSQTSQAMQQQVRQAGDWLARARKLLQQGQFDEAESIVQKVQSLRIPESAFPLGSDTPSRMMGEIARARYQASGRNIPASYQGGENRDAEAALYDSTHDSTQNRMVQNLQTLPTPAGDENVGMTHFRKGNAALKAKDQATARKHFQEAAKHMEQLDRATQQQLQQLLGMLGASAPANGGPQPGITERAEFSQQGKAQQMTAEVAQKTGEAMRVMVNDPDAAINMLTEIKEKVSNASLDQMTKTQLLRRIDRALVDTNNYIEENIGRIELDRRNQAVLEEIRESQDRKLMIEDKLKALTEECNQLLEEQRFEEAVVVAKRARELAPNDPITRQLVTTTKLISNHQSNLAIKEMKEEGYLEVLRNVDESSIPFDDNIPMQFAKNWKELKSRRIGSGELTQRERPETEKEILRKLETPVSLNFTEPTPLSSAINYLEGLSGVPMIINQNAIRDVGITSEETVPAYSVNDQIMLKSALNLILRDLGLTYVIRDEVLQITSEADGDGELYTATYDVADLIIPIPNFSPNGNMGMQSAFRQGMGEAAFRQAGAGMGGMGGISPYMVMASKDGSPSNGMIDPGMMAQLSGGGVGGSPTSMPISAGGGAAGGGQADFESIIELIQTTVQPDTWQEEGGGPGTITEYEGNMSLVIRQTEQVHEEIVDLLKQLRRLNDLQVTIEVRFITLNDNFFERMGIDFDFDINDDIDGTGAQFGSIIGEGDGDDGGDDNGSDELDRLVRDFDGDESVTVGLSSPGIFSADLDVPFSQNSFSLAVPQFGGFDASAGAQMGFAILSDIEAFFFMNAAQGDSRSNVLQAPKVTLFNGQQASVSDTSQSPFVMSVIPVVGDFAAAQQPVIVILNEGQFLTVQAVVSHDRQFVRLTLVPFFSQITDVDTFRFEGEESSVEEVTSRERGSQDTPASTDEQDVSRSRNRTSRGTTVQLPTYSFVSVSTTVSVPDGGTVLLGGIKRLSEGRNEYGVPILNKVPYLNRLFMNVGIGRETQSLMMTVTPRIIIQEEEEELLTGIAPTM